MDWRILSLAALLCAPLLLHGAQSEMDRATLHGLKAVGVVIDPIDPELEKQGLTRQTLQTEIEGRLQNAGVPVDKDSVAFIGLRVTWNRVRKGPQALGLVLALYQPVILTRDRNVKTVAPTWETGSAMLAQPKELFKSAIAAVDQVTAQFVKAYRAANPQQ